jgi:flagellar biosynthetic protein FlhB
MAESSGEKTEQASGKRLEDSREQGQVARSVEINSFLIFSAGISIIYVAKSTIGSGIKEMTITIFSSLNHLELTVDLLSVYAMRGFVFFISMVAPIFAGLVMLSLAAGYGQVGFKITPKVLQPKFSKLNPLNGVKRILFSAHSLVELLKTLTKLLVVGTFAYWVISDAILHSLELVRFSVEEILAYMVSTAFGMVWKISLLYGAIAGGDFFYQKYKHSHDLMMTKQEVKEENKQMEGDPQIKGRIRSKMIQMSRRRMLKDVPNADVVITNPTHVAIALKYDTGKKSAPVVLAKGLDLMAQRIKEVAKKHDIPMHEDVQLARALYKVCEVGDQIPTSFYRAVAQILAHIFQAKQAKKKRSII